ncbi:S49 family peptidase [Rhodoblastus acidophilus]|uniref:S49 family peptidase n=1 Tax=Rhodoblastus acidophilus TaxID=1074 RepID=A0A6N8DVX8_RHOAC|nr:S49 family peptidase [Rhodoblastus acidophilus]MCW2276369.1 signal peptide peptidase SppA [Rhodoblastus acidophilus]MTV33024.1 S49 family peptidase [Rhodoblastus acidophilus]
MPQTLRVASLVFNQPLMVEPSAAEALVSGLAERFGVDPLVEIDASRFVGRPSGPRGEDGRTIPMFRMESGVALISVMGELVNRGAWIGASSGLTSYEGLDAQLAAAEAAEVRAVILDVNSPGGQVAGAMETAARVRALSAKKPVYAFVNGLAASAGYAIAAGASKIVTTPSAEVGSIGVIMVHVDRSAQLEKAGAKPTIFTKGEFKADGHPYGPVSEEAAARIDARLESAYGLFVSSVAAFRGLSEQAVRDTKAGIFMGRAAVKAGLADAVGGLDDVFAMIAADLKAEDALGLAMRGNQGPKSMSETTITAEQLAAAETAAMALGAEAERKRVAAILGHDAAKGREALAQHLALQTDMAPEAAAAALAASPLATAAPKTHRLDAIAPNPAVDAQDRDNSPEDAVGAGLAAAVDRMIARPKR